MKLCWLIADEKAGGITSVALSCCTQAAIAGHQVTLLILGAKPGWTTDQRIKVHSLGLGPYSPEASQLLLQWLVGNPQDYAFLNGCAEADAIISFLPPDVRCIYVVHDTARQCWSSAIKSERDLDAIVAVSRTVASKLENKLNQTCKLFVIPNGCYFPTRPSPSTSRQDSLLFLGGDAQHKGAFDVLRLWKALARKGFSGELHWFGDMQQDFRRRIDKLPHRNRITLYGRVQRDVIFSTAATAKVLLALARAEAFGMATIEAMSMGCVPMAWNINNGTKEIVTANQTGLFAPLGDTRALAHQVMHACQFHSDFETKAIEHARSAFNEELMWKGYASLIKEISSVPRIERSMNGQPVPSFVPPLHRFQLLPKPVRDRIRSLVGRSPKLGHWLQDFRGW